MEFSEVVRRRRMVRRYDDRPVDPAVLDRMLEHATRAPSAGFTQGWAFLRLDTPESVARFWRATSPDEGASNDWLDGMRTAPVVIVPLSHKDAYLTRYAEEDKESSHQRWPVPYWHIDTGMAAMLILQTAVDEGLGACFFGIPDGCTQSFRDEFGVPPEFKPIGAITVGHRLPDTGSKGSPSRRRRRAVDEVVHRNGW
ncbi:MULTISPECIES: nitroreductase family protein [unclassified Nocardioides]|uniref:nitroreductase family protein n=1 Tax=unclassified Nocardioides TaxID=2615069 RepID=UPI0006F5B8F4|nr:MULTISPECIES: nitroreductase family protein [unclassified Nocardioides]KQY57089.1 nitroreductase [Nocardioides sp. Root140]KQZ68598.1 nitroreductase [Nocardioides sp. Root151]KRF11729.1 nitroreductase [Nocardioides sp. Soil796]